MLGVPGSCVLVQKCDWLSSVKNVKKRSKLGAWGGVIHNYSFETYFSAVTKAAVGRSVCRLAHHKKRGGKT